MDLTTLSLVLSSFALLVALVTLIMMYARTRKKEPSDSFSTRPLQLQAYERLVILAERIALPNLISRVNLPGASAREMQLMLIESIKQEYEYNASQQIYVSQTAWESIRHLRDQNMLVINQVANVLAPDARAQELNRGLLDVIMSQEKAALHTVVLNTLNDEAKQLMS